jgi:F-type H+-transporting ATPase subunit b
VKRATLLLIALVVIAAAGLSASVKVPQELKHPAAPAAQPAGEGQAAPAADAKREAQGGREGAAAAHGEPAAEHAGGEGEAAESPWAMVARLFNFALLAGILIYLLRSPFGAFLDGRKVQIRKSLTDAATTREEAVKQLAVIDEKLQGLPGEIEALKQRGISEIAAEEARIRQAAEVERQRMLENARREIDRRGHLVERQLLLRAGELAVSLATERVKRTINDADQARLVDRYLEQVRPETIAS